MTKIKKKSSSINVLNLKSDYIAEQEDIAKFFTLFSCLNNLNSQQFTKFKKNALKYLVWDDELF